MAKASTGRATPAKAKAAPPVVVRKKTKAASVEPKKKAAGKQAAAPKMTPAPRKGAAAKAPAPKKAAPTKKAAAPKKAAPVKKVAAKAKAPAPKKAAAPKAAAPKQAVRKAVVRTVAVKKAAARRSVTRIAVPTPAARRARTVAAPRKAPGATAAKPKTNPPQSFTVSHLNHDDFKADGLRTYAQYRDLGIAAATGGLCQAHVIRFTPPCTDEVRKRHVHTVDLQLVYVLQGWMKNEFEGHGEQMMSAGTCWLQPSGIRHTVLDYSADCEVLEIIVPADFKTEETT
ncbi:cupin domain-containing protein [Acidisphaera sp. S103]|uniref:cupin domain-containing protein n=1 Tax=Acidisphaera sp. S103 TaxID=1747223 RepID=UPI0020B12E0F|nr:cupin domain-containing protein [Acidisphaera sp. S103]